MQEKSCMVKRVYILWLCVRVVRKRVFTSIHSHTLIIYSIWCDKLIADKM